MNFFPSLGSTYLKFIDFEFRESRIIIFGTHVMREGKITMCSIARKEKKKSPQSIFVSNKRCVWMGKKYRRNAECDRQRICREFINEIFEVVCCIGRWGWGIELFGARCKIYKKSFMQTICHANKSKNKNTSSVFKNCAKRFSSIREWWASNEKKHHS